MPGTAAGLVLPPRAEAVLPKTRITRVRIYRPAPAPGGAQPTLKDRVQATLDAGYKLYRMGAADFRGGPWDVRARYNRPDGSLTHW